MPHARRAPLRAALTAFVPEDDRERAYHRRMLDLLDVAGDPFSRDHFVPGHFTASAFILAPDGEHLLMILHRKLGLWLQPGGHVDPEDHDIFASARREIAEETGVLDFAWFEGEPTVFDVDIHAIPPIKQDPPHEHFDVRVLVHATSPVMEAGEDVAGARWVHLDEVEGMGTDESVLRAVRKIKARG